MPTQDLTLPPSGSPKQPGYLCKGGDFTTTITSSQLEPLSFSCGDVNKRHDALTSSPTVLIFSHPANTHSCLFGLLRPSFANALSTAFTNPTSSSRSCSWAADYEDRNWSDWISPTIRATVVSHRTKTRRAGFSVGQHHTRFDWPPCHSSM